MIRMLIVSDIRLYREGLEEIINHNEEVKVVGTASNIEHAVLSLQDNNPQVILIDMTMAASCEFIDHISSTYPDIKIIALAISEDEDRIISCAMAGIAGYVSREASIEQLINTVCAAVDGELHVPGRIAEILYQNIRNSKQTNAGNQAKTEVKQPVNKNVPLLTRREKQIAALLTDGFSNKQIAVQLMIEVSTVKNHVHNILSKIGVHSRLQAVQMLQHHRVSD